MALGLPHKRTLVEALLYWTGLIGAAIGAIVAALSLLGYLMAYAGIGSIVLSYALIPLFSLGAFGAVSGLALAGFSQLLGTFRLMAHNSANSETKK